MLVYNPSFIGIFDLLTGGRVVYYDDDFYFVAYSIELDVFEKSWDDLDWLNVLTFTEY